MLNHQLFSVVGIMTLSSLLSIVRCRNRFWIAILVMLIRTKCSILVRGDSVFITMAVVVRGGHSGWLDNNLQQAESAPAFYGITAQWTFGGKWDPERRIRDLWNVLAY